jgi:AcrR family transcriptional regulator
MPRTVEQNQQLRDERREAILRAAREVFARKGLAATKISDIAAASDVSYGLVYHYFPSKEAVFATIVEGALRGTLALTAAALAREGTPWERLAWLCEEMLTGVRDDPEYYLVILQAMTSEAMPAEVRAILARASPRIFEDLRALIRQGQEAGQVVAGDPAELAITYTSLISGLSVSRFVERGVEGPFPSIETVLRLLRA